MQAVHACQPGAQDKERRSICARTGAQHLVFARQDARIQVSGEAREGRTGASSSQCGPGWSLLRVALPGSAVHAQNTVLPPPLRVDRARATGQGYVRPAGGWGACRVEGPG